MKEGDKYEPVDYFVVIDAEGGLFPGTLTSWLDNCKRNFIGGTKYETWEECLAAGFTCIKVRATLEVIKIDV